MKRNAVVSLVALAALAIHPNAEAQFAEGNWVNREIPQMTMTVMVAGSGYSITYRVPGPDGKVVLMTIQTPLDGSETPFLIDGKPTGQTYAGKRVDGRHTSGVVKLNGKVTATSTAELSADGKTITVENDSTMASGSASQGKHIEHWDRR